MHSPGPFPAIVPVKRPTPRAVPIPALVLTCLTYSNCILPVIAPGVVDSFRATLTIEFVVLTPSSSSKETTSLPEAASQSLAVLSALAVRILAPSKLNAASVTPS